MLFEATIRLDPKTGEVKVYGKDGKRIVREILHLYDPFSEADTSFSLLTPSGVKYIEP